MSPAFPPPPFPRHSLVRRYSQALSLWGACRRHALVLVAYGLNSKHLTPAFTRSHIVASASAACFARQAIGDTDDQSHFSLVAAGSVRFSHRTGRIPSAGYELQAGP